tara:strand:+ start:3012 stop:3533 length:522 start_codon:yes stop_codon:yes gene_type:complete
MEKNLVLLGMMGVGKSTLGRIVAEKCKLSFIDIDSDIEKVNKMTINKIFEKKGEKFFRFEEEKMTLNCLEQKSCIIALGGGAFINEKIRKKVLKHSISIWLDVSTKQLVKRLQNTKKRPILKNENIEGKINEIYVKRKDIYNLANYKIICNNLGTSEIVKKIINIYESKQNIS